MNQQQTKKLKQFIDDFNKEYEQGLKNILKEVKILKKKMNAYVKNVNDYDNKQRLERY